MRFGKRLPAHPPRPRTWPPRPLPAATGVPKPLGGWGVAPVPPVMVQIPNSVPMLPIPYPHPTPASSTLVTKGAQIRSTCLYRSPTHLFHTSPISLSCLPLLSPFSWIDPILPFTLSLGVAEDAVVLCPLQPVGSPASLLAGAEPSSLHPLPATSGLQESF